MGVGKLFFKIKKIFNKNLFFGFSNKNNLRLTIQQSNIGEIKRMASKEVALNNFLNGLFLSIGCRGGRKSFYAGNSNGHAALVGNVALAEKF